MKHLKAIGIVFLVPEDKADGIMVALQEAAATINEPLAVVRYIDRMALSSELSDYKDVGGSVEDNAKLALPPIKAGMKVRAKGQIDRFPHFLLPAGATGEVVNNYGDKDYSGVWIQMTVTFPELREWDNQVNCSDDAEFWAEFELITP